ncbi:MAG: hypothetical protein ACR2MQ_14440 [Gemmatimonadaceae bacterium]
MGNSLDPTKNEHALLTVAPDTLLTLRAALLTRPDLDTVFALRDAGYAGGDALYAAFEAYVREKDLISPQHLDVSHFFQRAGEFWTRCGWGQTSFAADGDAFCAVVIDGCWEAKSEQQPDPRGCHLTVGVLGAFLGKFADYPLSVLEVDGPATGSEQCRFLAGSAEMIGQYYAEHS